MWKDVAAFIACSTLALSWAGEVLDPLLAVLLEPLLDPLPGPLDPFTGVPLVLELQAAITVAAAMAAATLRGLRIMCFRFATSPIMVANSNRCPFQGAFY
jgi:hypothetical protein